MAFVRVFLTKKCIKFEGNELPMFRSILI